MGPRIGCILNATVGNVGEIIIAGFLIRAGEIEVVHASITGAIIGNLAEHVVGVTLAYKNKMDFSLLTSLGSATQIALFAAPVLVFFALLVGKPLTLVFTPLAVVAVAVSVFIASYIALDGKSNWVEGLQLISVYIILALAFFFLT